MKSSGIYKIQSKTKPERIYIGSAVNIKHRWSQHLFDLRLNKHSSQKLQNHYNKYGENDLIFIITELCFPEFLTAREQHYINKLKPYFNICKIAGSSLGIKRSEEYKRKISEANKGHKHTKEWKIKISQRMKGNKHALGSRGSLGYKFTPEQIKKLSIAHKGQKSWNKGKKGLQVAWNKGKSFSEESKKKMSDSHKLYWLSKKGTA